MLFYNLPIDFYLDFENYNNSFKSIVYNKHSINNILTIFSNLQETEYSVFLCKILIQLRKQNTYIEEDGYIHIRTSEKAVMYIKRRFCKNLLNESLLILYLDKNMAIKKELFITNKKAFSVFLNEEYLIKSRPKDILMGGIIVAHNHPGGNPNPSKEDIITSRHISNDAIKYGYQLLDSFVVTSNEITSIIYNVKFKI